MKKNDVLKSVKVISLNPKSQEKEETLRVFIDELSKSLNISIDDFEINYTWCNYHVVHNKKPFNGSDLRLLSRYSNEKFKIQFTPVSSNTVELQWIEVFDNGNGLGTDLMNDILDVSDKTGINIKVLPVDFKCNEFGGYLNRLREWYRSFGFTSKIYNKTPYLHYYSQKVELKMVS